MRTTRIIFLSLKNTTMNCAIIHVRNFAEKKDNMIQFCLIRTCQIFGPQLIIIQMFVYGRIKLYIYTKINDFHVSLVISIEISFFKLFKTSHSRHDFKLGLKLNQLP